MRRHHRAGLRPKIECRGGSEIDARLRLVIAGNLGAEYGIPGKIVAARQIDHQRNIAVRYRRQQIVALEPGEAARYVGPSVEPMPG
jgi:hypothetical protein